MGQTLKTTEARLGSARDAWKAQPTNAPVAASLAKACFDRAEWAADKPERALLAEEGIRVATASIKLDARLASGHLYLAMNLGQLARTRTFSALGLVDQMEVHFLEAIRLDPALHHAAPHRSLGLLYLEAPGWPASIGSRSKARLHLQKAVELAPEYPENLLSLLEAQIRWGEGRKVEARLEELDRILEKGQTRWQGEEWAESWKDWRERASKVRLKGHPESSPPRRTH